jgi:hypothetical protein
MQAQRTIAETILAQLGGNKFLAMTGAKDLLAGSNNLQFRLPKLGANKMNIVRITLMTDDTYMMEFWKLRGLNLTAGDCIKEIYAERLQERFEDCTGYYVYL